MDRLITLLAQAPNKPPPGNGIGMLFPAAMIGIIVFMFLSMRSQKKKEQRQKDEMQAKMAKNDRVLTVGGVIGTVISVKENEVVVKVDESTNTKMTFLKSAIQRILSDEQDVAEQKR